MKTPISYWGGKQCLASIIINLIPEHRIYCEPFAGGAAILFAKRPSPVEIINDLNKEIFNFYEVVQQDFSALQNKIYVTLHSRKTHHQAWVVYKNPDLFNRVKRAWAIWVLANQSFGSMLSSSWGSDGGGKKIKAINNKRQYFNNDFFIRIKNIGIENMDASQLIKKHDALDCFFYLDPPYVGADQGHYAEYTQKHFDDLLECLAGIKGKFLLSSYRNENLDTFKKQYSWNQIEVEMNNATSSSQLSGYQPKIEVLTSNYHLLGERQIVIDFLE
ncbi:restriction endonuclease subunit M [Spirochaetia bacterium]|nr:restriction endonuclease subunit M [Spirochaetia bacterium]